MIWNHQKKDCLFHIGLESTLPLFLILAESAQLHCCECFPLEGKRSQSPKWSYSLLFLGEPLPAQVVHIFLEEYIVKADDHSESLPSGIKRSPSSESDEQASTSLKERLRSLKIVSSFRVFMFLLKSPLTSARGSTCCFGAFVWKMNLLIEKDFLKPNGNLVPRDLSNGKVKQRKCREWWFTYLLFKDHFEAKLPHVLN